MSLYVNYDQSVNYDQTEIVAAAEQQQHFLLTCETMAEVSAGGAWVEMSFIPYVCWGILFPNDQRIV